MRTIASGMLLWLLLESTALPAQTVSVAGTVVNETGSPIPAAKVGLGIGTTAAERIADDSTTSDGLFQLVKYPVNQLTELWVWIEEPYSHPPQKLAIDLKQEVIHVKLPPMKVTRTKTGVLREKEALDRLATIFSIENRKLALGIHDEATFQKNLKDQSIMVLSRVNSIDKPDQWTAFINKSKNTISKEDQEAFASRGEKLLREINSDTEFMKQVAVQKKLQAETASYLNDYLRNQCPYDPVYTQQFLDSDPTLFDQDLSPSDLALVDLSKYLKSKGAKGTLGTVYFWPTARTPKSNLAGLDFNLEVPPTGDELKSWINKEPAYAPAVLQNLLKIRVVTDPNVPAVDKKRFQVTLQGREPIFLPKK